VEPRSRTNAGGTADPDGLDALGTVITGDAVTSQPIVAANAGAYSKFNLFLTGPKYFSRETTIQIEANAAAATFTAGSMWIRVEYVMLAF